MTEKQKNGGFAGENSRKIRISSIEPEFITPKSPQPKAILVQKEVESFIDSVVAENTRKTYVRALELLEEYMGKTISEIIKERREDFKSNDITLRRQLDRKVEQFMHACIYCREPSSCLATFEEEGREIWRYICEVCYKLLENDDREGLIKRLDEKGIVVCEAYYPKNPTKREFIFRTKKELEKS